MNLLLPSRINLAIANNCFIRCPGCYQNFGKQDPELHKISSSVSRFVELGISRVTLSGGDPLTIPKLIPFLCDLRKQGVLDIKVDTVGTALIEKSYKSNSKICVSNTRLDKLLNVINFIGIPIDGVSPSTVATFRKGRSRLVEETQAILKALDNHKRGRSVIINTVVHKKNIFEIPQLYKEIEGHPSVVCWNVFQYTSTDQVSQIHNSEYSISESDFQGLKDEVETLMESQNRERKFLVQFSSVKERFGRYLLLNSDGQSWIPDIKGNTIQLGNVFGQEQLVLHNWSETVQKIKQQTLTMTTD